GRAEHRDDDLGTGQRRRRLHGLGGCDIELSAGMFGDDEHLAHTSPRFESSMKSEFASLTMMPRCRPGGGSVLSTLTRGAPFTPSSANGMLAIGLVFAFMISGSFTKRGSLRRRSVVTTAG